MLEINNLESGYGHLKVLKNISIHVASGQIVTIIGANGAGKTTLLHTIAGLLRITSGEVMLHSQNLKKMSPEKIVKLGCSLVPEGRQLFAPMTVKENLILGGYIHRKNGPAISSGLERIYEMFPRLKERENQLAGTLSGGEQQMLAIGRALMAKPSLIMMDEPSTGLAPLVVKEMFEAVVKLRDNKNTVLLVEQNAKAALSIADQGYVLETGKITLEGPAQDLLSNKKVQHAYLGKDVV